MKNLFFIACCILLSACNLSNNKIPLSIELNDTVLLHFTLYNNKMEKFDESDHSNHQADSIPAYPLRIVIGKNYLITGIDSRLIGLNENDSIFSKIPAQEAFGERGLPLIIAPNEDIYLSAKIIKIIKGNENSHI